MAVKCESVIVANFKNVPCILHYIRSLGNTHFEVC